MFCRELLLVGYVEDDDEDEGSDSDESSDSDDDEDETGSPGTKKKWTSCLDAIADAIRSIANDLSVCAKCEVDIGSGLPEFPIHGNLKFTQPVTVYNVLCLNLLRFIILTWS